MILTNVKSGMRLFSLLSLLTLAGCASLSRTEFPVGAQAQAADLPENVRVIPISAENISSFSARPHTPGSTTRLTQSRSQWQYNIGIGDVLSITVWDHPELTLPAGPTRSQLESGSTVNENGDIFYPYLGLVRVSGRLVGDVQRELTERLEEFIPDPQIEVKIAAYNAQKVVVTGAVVAPASLPITNIPLTLLEAINASGGLTEVADSRQVSIRRRGANNYVNLRSFLDTGRAGGNPVLRGGDVINVPVANPSKAFILGQISQPGMVDLGPDSSISLTEALTLQGGLVEAEADAKGIFVFRNREAGIDVYQLDATTPLAFVLATKFMLHADDVVYIVADPAARWNRIITQLVPTIGAVRQAQIIGNNL
ncbi:MAG: polysaccharide biosynthesis/export family protein [Rhodobacteraceae bacterium]|nr:polysaccharide biosynthesis/export family protein [Paracoccaceae bacterium]